MKKIVNEARTGAKAIRNVGAQHANPVNIVGKTPARE